MKNSAFCEEEGKRNVRNIRRKTILSRRITWKAKDKRNELRVTD